MTIVMFACSRRAYELLQELKIKWEKQHPEDRLAVFVKCADLPEISDARSLTEITGEWFARADALIFICAAGIAVRSIAPYVKHKSVDPAVLVIDETGRFCISLLSGHMGGANEMAREVASLFIEKAMIPVITTATDRTGTFAVDEFARKNHLAVTDFTLAKEISARLLRGEKAGFCSLLPVRGTLPKELETWAGNSFGILVSYRETEKMPYQNTLRLIPKALSLGIGCKKDTPLPKIEEAVSRCFLEEGLLQEGIAFCSSIDLKKQEAGILEYCKKNDIPFLTYSAKELSQVTGEFTASGFVSKVTGVENVCERSAALTALKKSDDEEEKQEVRMLVRKKCYDKVTLAVAEITGRLVF